MKFAGKIDWRDFDSSTASGAIAQLMLLGANISIHVTLQHHFGAVPTWSINTVAIDGFESRVTGGKVLLKSGNHSSEALVSEGKKLARRALGDIAARMKQTDEHLPKRPCAVVWCDGHPWVLDGEPGIPSERHWVGIRTANGLVGRMSRADMLLYGPAEAIFEGCPA